MQTKIRVVAKAQNRSALGVIHAYMQMFPQTTLEELRKAFPNSINPDKGVGENFVLLADSKLASGYDGYFNAPEELIRMGDGELVAVVKMWTKPSLERLVSASELYGISIAPADATGVEIKRGSFALEYLNGYTPARTGKKGIPLWVWLLALILLGAVVFYLLG